MARAQSERRVDGKVSSERRYYLSRLAQDAVVMNAAIRTHWALENGLHGVLDVSFGEDGCRIRKDHAPQNMSLLRQMALNRLGPDKATKIGIKAKRQKAGWDDAYLLKILAQSFSCVCPGGMLDIEDEDGSHPQFCLPVTKRHYRFF